MSKGKVLAGRRIKLRNWGLHDPFCSKDAIGGQPKADGMLGGHLEFWRTEKEAM